jgi:hypothetical protein
MLAHPASASATATKTHVHPAIIRRPLIRVGAFSQANPRPAAALGDELDAGDLEGGADGVDSALAQWFASLEARDRAHRHLGCFC